MKRIKRKPPAGYIRFSVALLAYLQAGGKARSKQAWSRLLHGKQVAGAFCDGFFWWVPPTGIRVVLGKPGRPVGAGKKKAKK